MPVHILAGLVAGLLALPAAALGASGGGHRRFQDQGYDCSGSVSFALHGGGLLASPLPSSDFMRWGERGRGQWITVYTNPGHAFVIIAGLRFDTSGPGERGPRWRTVA